MKTIVTALALSIVTATPMLAQAATRPSAQASDQQLTQSPHIYWHGQDIGTDPDPSVRFDLQRDAGHYGSHY